MGSLAALSTSKVEESRGASAWRRRMEKVAAASVEEMTAASSTDFSDGHPNPKWRHAYVAAAVSSTPQMAMPMAGSATVLTSRRFVTKPPWKRMNTSPRIGDLVRDMDVVEIPRPPGRRCRRRCPRRARRK